MKITNMLKLAGLMVLVLSVAVGCAGAPEEAPAGDAQAAQEAIAAAKSAQQRAADEGYVWRDTDGLIAKAEEAYAAGNYQEATDLANEARRQAELAVQQKYDEMQRVQPVLGGSGTASSYTVERGDSLWAISAKPEVYDNPYQWPLIYKANQDSIRDADLIFPGQTLSIDQNASAAEMDAAVQHARTRGAWTLGEVEYTDQSYLGR